jgi:hypothetical protein
MNRMTRVVAMLVQQMEQFRQRAAAAMGTAVGRRSVGNANCLSLSAGVIIHQPQRTRLSRCIDQQ